jgi:SAM-dependent MidA family methyltransferase
MSPAEMGELFKAIAFERSYPSPLKGFREGDRRQAL